MVTVYKKIRMKTLLVFFVALVSLLWAANSLAGDDPQERASREVIARLAMSADAKAKVDAVFTQYQGTIEARKKAMDEAYSKALDAQFDRIKNKTSGDDVKAAKATWDRETKLYETTIHERDGKVKQSLPPALAPKFERGMKLVTEREGKCETVLKESFDKMMKGATQAERDKIQADANKKFDAIYDEYDKKLDAEVGKVIEKK